jgi:hypothetical protein
MKSKIDFENRVIYGRSGKIYKILPEMLTIGRAAEFEIRSILIGYKTDFETLLKLISNVETRLRNGNTWGTISDVINDLKDFKQGLINYQLNSRPAIVEFMSLFCIGDGEDTGIHSEEIIREKFEDWREISEQDFFLLCANVIPSFRSNYLQAVKEQKLPK